MKLYIKSANSGDLSDDYDILYDFFIDNEETIAKFGFEEFFDSERQLISFSSQDVDETSDTATAWCKRIDSY